MRTWVGNVHLALNEELSMQIKLLKLALLLAIRIIGGCACCGKKSTPPPDNSATVSPIPRLARVIPLPGVGVPPSTAAGTAIPGRLDHLAYDRATGRLFIAALEQGSVEVVDLNKGERIQRIEGLKKPQGIAVVPASEVVGLDNKVIQRTEGRLVVACGGEDAVHVYDLHDLKELAVTPIGADADNVRWMGAERVCVGFGAEGQPCGLAVYDAARTQGDPRNISLPSHPESFQFTGGVNIEPAGSFRQSSRTETR